MTHLNFIASHRFLFAIAGLLLIFNSIVPQTTIASEDESIIEEVITFSNRGITLHGTISQLPTEADPSPRPALIMVHGSGPGSRSEFEFIVKGYINEGFIVLAYDKRSNWTRSSLYDLADDVVAAAKYMAAREDVDSSRIGALGVSQGGWVIPIAAMRSNHLDFLIVITGGGASPREVETFQMLGSAMHNGADQADLEIIKNLSNMFYDTLETGTGHTALKIELEKYKERSWFGSTPFARGLPDEDDTTFWSWVGSYLPVETISLVKIPTLVLLGTDDFLVPLEASEKAWNEGFKVAGMSSSSIVRVIDGAGHGLTVGNSHGGGNRQYIETYFELQKNWLNSIDIPPKISLEN